VFFIAFAAPGTTIIRQITRYKRKDRAKSYPVPGITINAATAF
jgi:hypothetical protein